MEEWFLLIIQETVAGNPKNSDIKWTYLNRREISDRLFAKGYQASEYLVGKLLRKHNLRKRKIAKVVTYKNHKDRDQQFKNIERRRKWFSCRGYAVISVDVKEKVTLGSLYRPGEVYGEEAQKSYDHDFPSYSDGKVIPHAIYDVNRNQGYVNLNMSKDTSELFFDSVLLWWEKYGSKIYEKGKPILILCDGGGSNNCRHHIFKETLQKLADTIGCPIRVAHYPAYCSKYNPIEHRLFPHITRALSGIMIDSMETMKMLIEQRATTVSQLQVHVTIIDKVYKVGRKVSENFWNDCKIIFDSVIALWNYRVLPRKTNT